MVKQFQNLFANAFNDFFISIGDVGVLNTDINNDFNKYMPRKTNCTLKFEPITVDTVIRIIGGLTPKTSTGVDSISNKLVKFVKNVISEPLPIIIKGHSMSNHPMVETVPPQILMKIYTFGVYGQKRRFAK